MTDCTERHTGVRPRVPAGKGRPGMAKEVLP